MGSGTLISWERRATSSASGGSATVHRCSLIGLRTISPRAILLRPPRERRGRKMQVCKPNSVCSVQRTEEAAISLGRGLLLGSSDLPGSNSPLARRVKRAASPPLFGLAPDGVCPAPLVADGAVSSYLAISPLPLETAGHASGRPSGRYRFCDTFRASGLGAGNPPLFTGHPALRSSDFAHHALRRNAAARPAW